MRDPCRTISALRAFAVVHSLPAFARRPFPRTAISYSTSRPPGSSEWPTFTTTTTHPTPSSTTTSNHSTTNTPTTSNTMDPSITSPPSLPCWDDIETRARTAATPSPDRPLSGSPSDYVRFDIDTFDDQHLGSNLSQDLRLRPSMGRFVPVSSASNVARSFRLLDILVRRNRIRQDFMSQRFHERPGLKRKRLRSLRWRKRFKVGFAAAVNRAQELVKQGW